MNSGDYLIPKEIYDELFSDYIELVQKEEQLQQENAQLKDKIKNATKLIEEIKLHYQQSPTMIPNVKINKLEDSLKEN